MEAYSNCRQFNCVPPIVEQSEYHMFCREKCELHLPEMYNKIGVGLCAWGPLSMALGDAQNGERLLFPKNSFKTKSHSYSWTEDELNKNVSESDYTHNRNCDDISGWKCYDVFIIFLQSFNWSKERIDETRKQSDKVRDLCSLAEKLGCSPTQLSIAWTLKHEPVQCLLIGATNVEQLHQNLQALQVKTFCIFNDVNIFEVHE